MIYVKKKRNFNILPGSRTETINANIVLSTTINAFKINFRIYVSIQIAT